MFAHACYLTSALCFDLCFFGMCFVCLTGCTAFSSFFFFWWCVCVLIRCQARDDWQIVAAVAETVGSPLPYTTDAQVHARLVEVAPHFGRLNERQVFFAFYFSPTNHHLFPPVRTCVVLSFGGGGAHACFSFVSTLCGQSVSFVSSVTSSSLPLSLPLPRALSNHFTADPISRASKTLATCAASLPNATNSYTHTPPAAFMDL